MIKQLPNILTLANLFCGATASVLLIQGAETLPICIVLIIISLVCDFLDGFVARAVKANSLLGKELDSLADCISFGFFPAVAMYTMMSNTTNLPHEYASFASMLIACFSAYRLALFNLDEDQSYYFKGLPTPANTILILSLLYIQLDTEPSILMNYYFLLPLTIISSYILIASLPLFALKFKNFKFKGNELVFLFIPLCVVLIILLKMIAIPIIIGLYILISIIFRAKITKK